MVESTQGGTWSGREGGDSESELLAHHEGLVRWVVRRQRLGPLSFEDAVHEGRIGLWQALRHYDPARGTRFSTYAVPAITHAIWQAVAREQRSCQVIPARSEPVADADLAEMVQLAALVAAVRAAVAELPAPLREVVVAHVGLDGSPPETFATIGARLGRTRQRAHQLFGEATLRLAHPAHSRALRLLTERQSREAYRATLARQQRRARARRSQP